MIFWVHFNVDAVISSATPNSFPHRKGPLNPQQPRLGLPAACQQPNHLVPIKV
jgi:hypothetical protein